VKRWIIVALAAVLLCLSCSIANTATTVSSRTLSLLEGSTFYDEENTTQHQYYLVGRWDSHPKWGSLQLDECNSLGLFCRTVYKSELMDLDRDFELEIDSQHRLSIQGLNFRGEGETIFSLESPTR
jgi:hypothetical protein